MHVVKFPLLYIKVSPKSLTNKVHSLMLSVRYFKLDTLYESPKGELLSNSKHFFFLTANDGHVQSD